MPGFCEFAAIYVVMAVYRTLPEPVAADPLARWMTTATFSTNGWRTGPYYRISLTTDRAAIGTDNPDQRIAEDLRDFVSNTLSLGLDLLSNVVSLFSYLGILWGLSGALTVFGISIPGYMVWVALVYSAIGTWLTHLVGRPLVPLSFRQQRVEADFRYALVRLRENMEGVALYNGEAEENANLQHRFASVIGNWWAIMRRTKLLNSLVVGYSQIANVFPLVVAAPRYFSGTLQLGGLMQTADAFGQVQGSMSWFLNAYASLAQWRAIVERLTTFHRAIVLARAAAGQGSDHDRGPGGCHRPARRDDRAAGRPQAVAGRRADVQPRHVGGGVGALRVPASRRCSARSPASGRSAAAQVQRPAERVLFLPQRAVYPAGTLRHVVCYPSAPGTHTPEEIAPGAGGCRAAAVCRPAGRGRGMGATPVGRRAAAHRAGACPAGEAGLAVPGRGDREPGSGGGGAYVSHIEATAAGDHDRVDCASAERGGVPRQASGAGARAGHPGRLVPFDLSTAPAVG